MRGRSLIQLLAVTSVPMAWACSAGETTDPRDAAATQPAALVAAGDIPADVVEDSWARLPLPRRDDLEADGQRAYDMITAPDSRYASGLRGPVAMWVYSPLMAEHVFPASSYLRYGTAKDQRLTELTILATARELRSQYEWTSHEPAAVRAGLEREIIDLVKQRSDLTDDAGVPGLGETERTIIAFVREVVSEEKVSSDTFARALGQFGEQGVMELAGLVGYYSFVAMTIKTFDVQVAPGDERLLPDLW